MLLGDHNLNAPLREGHLSSALLPMKGHIYIATLLGKAGVGKAERLTLDVDKAVSSHTNSTGLT